MTDAMHDYLTALLADNSTRDALEHLGYSSASFGSLRVLCSNYDVEIPARTNQHSTMPPASHQMPQEARKRYMATPATRREIGVERAVILGDLHVPYQDDRAVELALAIVTDLQPEVVIFNGDVWDAFQVSRFSKSPERVPQMQADLDEASAILGRFRAAVPAADMRLVRGNHEARLERYLCDEAPALHGLRDLDVAHLLNLAELNIEYVRGRGKEAYTQYGSILVGHFDKVHQKAGYTATSLLEKHAQSLVQGHTHRGAVVYRSYPDGREVCGVEGFCLCDRNPEYVSDPDWMNGLVVITKRVDTDRFHITPVPFVDNEALFSNTLYSA